MKRRDFLSQVSRGGGSLVLAWILPSRLLADGDLSVGSPDGRSSTPPALFRPNAFLEIRPDDTVILTCPNPEMGQGVRTMLPMIVADELGANWSRVEVRQADVDDAYAHQFSGGSLALIFNWDPLRKAGAVARAMLLSAAAGRWQVPEGECSAQGGFVRHAPSGRELRFGELAAAAASLPMPDPETVPLRSSSEYTLIGRRIPSVDAPSLAIGAPLFGIDVELPEMLHASIERAPVPGGKLISANLDELRRQPGVVHVALLSGSSEYGGPFPGIAIVATSTWAALTARRRISARWDESPSLRETSAELEERLRRSVEQPGRLVRMKEEGTDDAPAAFTHAATYEFGFVAHATMEPQNATARVDADGAELWIPSQQPGEARDKVAQLLRLPKDKVKVHVTRIGGGFGRRLFNDYVLDAVEIAREVRGRPVKLTWTREDDFARSYFRYGGACRLEARVDAHARIIEWTTRLVHLSNKPEDRPIAAADFDDASVAELLVPRHRWEGVYVRTTIPWGMWRAPGDCTSAWYQFSFLDELAHAAGMDPLAFHLQLLGEPRVVGRGPDWSRWETGRMRAVVLAATERAEWSRSRPRGRGLGLAYFRSHLGYCAQVAEVTVSREGELRVERIQAVLDVGPIMNLAGAEHQVRGGILDALGACWQQDATFEQGRLQQRNFDTYPLLRCGQHPEIDIHFVQGTERPTGLGEPPVPPTPPAVTNAIYAATGIRVRRLPIARQDLRWT